MFKERQNYESFKDFIILNQVVAEKTLTKMSIVLYRNDRSKKKKN